jgi:chromosome segregation ATPase|tara:strand:+ start:188 stop:430 length:243 start_codon:yes stop_codon:yes gene_type:complete
MTLKYDEQGHPYEDVTPEIKKLRNRIKELEAKCREAGRAMIELNLKYETNLKEIERLDEENTNLKVLLKGTDGKNSDNNS